MAIREFDLRGNCYDRRRRREWLLNPESGFNGDGVQVPCYHCGRSVNYGDMDVDRFPICGHDGGRYVRSNIVPSCSTCNRGRCGRCEQERRSR